MLGGEEAPAETRWWAGVSESGRGGGEGPHPCLDQLLPG